MLLELESTKSFVYGTRVRGYGRKYVVRYQHAHTVLFGFYRKLHINCGSSSDKNSTKAEVLGQRAEWALIPRGNGHQVSIVGVNRDEGI